MTPRTKIDRALQNIILTQPFYGSLLLLLDIVEVPEDEHPGMTDFATNGTQLLYKVSGVDRLNSDEVEATMCHEVLHCALLHPYRLRNRDHKKFNYACDYVVNPIVNDSNLKMPANSLFHDKYGKMTAEACYSILKDKDTDTPQYDSIGLSVLAPVDGAGKPLTEEEGHLKEQEWQGAAIQASIYAKSRGELPQGISDALDVLLQAKFPWREILANFMLRKRPTRLDWGSRSRRSLCLNMYLPNRYKEPTGEFVIAVDTSGSVSDKELQAGYSEILGLLHQIQPERCIIIQCDSHIPANGITEYTMDNIPDNLDHIEITCRGGTDFNPPLRWIENEGIIPNAFVYFTDGEAPWPDEPDYPMLWAFTQELQDYPPFGEHLWLDI
jgi:predicted metal-dependent peptidase